MAQQNINIGSSPNDNNGDTLRTGGDKINDNFTELYTDQALDNAARHTHANKATLDAIEEAYSTSEKNKLAGLPNVSEWNEQNGSKEVAGAVYFNGVSDEIGFEVPDSWMATSDSSFSLWVRGDDFGLSKGENSPNVGFVIQAPAPPDDTRLRFFVSDTGGPSVFNDVPVGPLMDGSWHHFTVSFNASTLVFTVFVDGEQTGTADFSGQVSTIFESSAPLLLGQSYNRREYEARELILFNKQLSLSDAQALYDRSLGAIRELGGFGSEFINDDFSNDSNWNAGTSWSISGGSASFDGAATGNLVLIDDSLEYQDGQKIKAVIEVTNSTGGTIQFRSSDEATVLNPASTEGFSSSYATLSNGINEVEFTIQSSGNGLSIRANTASSYDILDIQVEVLGSFAAYPLNEGRNVEIFDISPNRNHANDYSNFEHVIPTLQEGYKDRFFTQAIKGGIRINEITGTSWRGIDAGKSPIEIGKEYTIAADLIVRKAPNSNVLLFQLDGDSTANRSAVLLDSDNLFAAEYLSNSSQEGKTYKYSLNERIRFIATFNNGTVELFINGIKSRTVKNYVASGAGGNEQLLIFSNPSATPKDSGIIELSNVILWNKALTNDEALEVDQMSSAAIQDVGGWGKPESSAELFNLASATDNGTSDANTADFTATVNTGNWAARHGWKIAEGQQVRVRINVSSLPAGGAQVRLNNYAGNTSMSSLVDLIAGSQTVLLTATTYDEDGFFLRVSVNTSGQSLTAEIERVDVIGAVVSMPLDDGIGLQVHDDSPNARDGLIRLPALVNHLLPKTEDFVLDTCHGGVRFDGVAGFYRLLTNDLKDLNIAGSVSIDLKPIDTNVGNYFLIKQGGTDQRLQLRGSVDGIFYNFANSKTGTITLDKAAAHRVTITWTGSFFSIFVNGKEVVSDVAYAAGAAGADGTVNWGLGAFVNTGAASSYAECEVSNFLFFNRALTSDEVTTLYKYGAAAIQELGGYGASDLVVNGNAESDITGWETTNSGGTASAITHNTTSPITGSGDALLSVTTGGNSFYPRVSIELQGNVTVKAGNSYKVKATTKLNSGTTTLRSLTLGQQSGGVGEQNVSLSGTQEHEFILSPSSDVTTDKVFLIFNSSAGAFDVQIDNVEFEVLGCIADLPLDEGIGFQLHDRSPNKNDGLLSETGFAHLIPKTEGFVRDFAVDAYNGGAGNTAIITSTRDILPDEYAINNLVVKNQNSANVIGTFELKRGSEVANAFAVQTATLPNMIEGTRVNVPVLSEIGNPNDRKKLFVTASDPDATNMDVRLDYSIIN